MEAVLLPRNADTDWVMDAADRCSETMIGSLVDANGCLVKIDGDHHSVADNKAEPDRRRYRRVELKLVSE